MYLADEEEQGLGFPRGIEDVLEGGALATRIVADEQVGRLTVLKAKMNPDLQMPDLLRNTDTTGSIV